MQNDNPKMVYVLFRKKKRVPRSMTINPWEIYVGITENFENRLETHSRLGLAIGESHDIHRSFIFQEKGCPKLELDLTLGLALQFGYQNVKGSNFSSETKNESLKEMCCAVTDRCYACFEKGKKANRHNGCNKKNTMPGTKENLDHITDINVLSAIFCQ
jgi:hypothetical protein